MRRDEAATLRRILANQNSTLLRASGEMARDVTSPDTVGLRAAVRSVMEALNRTINVLDRVLEDL
jgi:hypothetical protein